jgi:energy-coupling factor transport system permease protein
MSGSVRKNDISVQARNFSFAQSRKVRMASSVDPRTKLILTALFTLLVFIIDNLAVAAVQMLVFIGLCLAVGIPLKKVFNYGKYLLLLIALLIGLQVIFGQGLLAGLMIGCRIITLSVLMQILTMTTDIQILALGITRLGLNYKAAYIITSAFNFIPSFEAEARLIMDARKLRGMKSVKLTEYPAIALPLMIKAMRQAQMTGLAMDARAFGAYPARTWMRDIKFSALDCWAFAGGIAWTAAVITANIFLKR